MLIRIVKNWKGIMLTVAYLFLCRAVYLDTRDILSPFQVITACVFGGVLGIVLIRLVKPRLDHLLGRIFSVK